MARKKKALKDLKEHKNNTTTEKPLQDPSSPITAKKRNSFDENILQTQEKQQQKFTQYQSDGELMELKQKLNLEKNKSNLFLIKSYSFIDKTSNKRPSKQLNVKEKLQEFDKFQKTQLSKQNGDLLEKGAKSKKSSKTKEIQKGEEKKEKPKKPPKLKKMKKSKSTHDSTENLEDFRELLRKPSVILEDEVKTEETKRPQSLPVSQGQHRSVMKSKTLDDIETPRLKRDSFIRHSLQSIRRSFSSSKKHNNNISITSSSSSSSSSSSGCSNSSTASDSLRKSKTKDNNKDIGNLRDVEDSNYLIAVEEEEFVDGVCQSQTCNVVITLNDAQTLDQTPEHSNQNCSSQTPPAALLSTSSTTSYTMESLAVLKEEDEKDLCSCFNPQNGASCSSPQPPSVNNVQSSLAQLPTDSSALSPMAPLQTHTECLSVQCLNTLDQDYKSTTTTTNNNNTATAATASSTTSSSSSPPQTKTKRIFQQQLSIPESLQSTSIGCATSSEYSSARSLKHSATSLTPLPSLNTSGSLRSISPSRRSASSSNSSSTAKHEQSTTAAAAAAAAAANATTSNGSTVTMTTSSSTTAAAANATTTPPEKEKKRKEISSSRVKKFHRHFAQVSKDEKLINYFSCALVSDILLQGHLYITDQHFAFYSNVFGYVTKVVIPTSSVTKISKEKTAKIIPNAVGVATADERHVFGSFISREAAFRLMCSVCPPLGVPEILPKDPANIEISEEYSIEDDSSCSISGNESPAQITELQQANGGGGKLLQTNETTSQTLLRRSVGSSNLSIADLNRHSDIPINAKSTITANTASTRCSAPPATGEHYKNNNSNGGGAVNLIGLKSVLQQPALKPTPDGGEVCNNTNKLTIIAGCASTTTSATSTPTPSTSSSPTTVMTSSALSPASSKAKRVLNTFTSVSQQLLKHVKFPTEIHVVYLGVLLTLLLALFSIFLLYRILDIEAKTSGYRSPVEFNWRSGNDDDIFTEALRFQKQLQLKSTEEAQNILKTNLEQIAKVRRSLETLSMLIHDRSSSFVSTHTDDSD